MLSDFDINNKYWKLIDLMYFQGKGFLEDYDQHADSVTWFFNDGTSIELFSEELVNIAALLYCMKNGSFSA